MDPVTHTLTGAALSRAGYHRATPLATVTLMLAANAPDIDIVVGLGGPYLSVAYHRGLTHSIFAIPFLALGVMLVVLAYDRWVRRRRRPDAEPASPLALFLLGLLGCATHPLLDWLNTYGIRLLLPAKGEWYYGDTLFIVDPWVWLMLGGGVYLAGALPLRGSGGVDDGVRWGGIGWGTLVLLASLLILVFPLPVLAKVVWTVGLLVIAGLRIALPGGVRVRSGIAEGPARWGLSAAVVYISIMVWSSAMIESEVREELVAEGFTVGDLMVAPEPADPFRRMIIATTREGYLLGRYDKFGDPRIEIMDEPVPLPPMDEVAAEAASTTDARHFLVWARFPVFSVRESGDGAYLVRISDLRFTDGSTRGLGGVLVRVE